MTKDKILKEVGQYAEYRLEPKLWLPFVDKVPVSGGVLLPPDIVRLVDVALGGWITEGQQCAEFAKKLRKHTGIRHVVLCNSGSSANLLAMSALVDKYEIPKGSLIVTSALAFQTTVAPIIQNGMIPYFVDADWTTLNPDYLRVKRLAENKDVRGLILAHTLGFPIREIKAIVEYYHSKGKFVIEDCCDALGAFVDSDHHVGVYGDAATLSFFPAHHITTGEGGAVLTNDGQLFSSIRSYCNWGRDCWCKPGNENTCKKRFDWVFPKLPEHFDHKYIITKIGYNMKMTDLQAAIGNSQMDRIGSITLRRQSNYYYLRDGCCQIPNFFESFYMIHETEPYFTFSPFGFVLVCLKSVVNRADFVKFLSKRKIETRPIFTGNITRHPMMEHINYVTDGSLNGSDLLMEDALWLGCHPELSLTQLDFVLQSIDDYLVKLWKR